MAVMIVYPKSKDRCTMVMGLAAANKIQSMPIFKIRGEKLTAFFLRADVIEHEALAEEVSPDIKG